MLYPRASNLLVFLGDERKKYSKSTFFIASEISNYNLLQKLELLSTLDMLTGVMNRNTMNNDVDKVADGKGEISAPYAMRIADERMYEDKKKYYAHHPERVYR